MPIASRELPNIAAQIGGILDDEQRDQ